MPNKNEESFDTIMMVYVGFKLLRILFTYASLMIAKNYSAQVYMEKVLVNGDNPPALSNFITMYMMIEAVMIGIFIALLMAVDHGFKLNLLNDDDNLLSEFVLPDYIIGSILTISIGSIIANKMYQKKYFLYKDDGLRAIRALSEMMFTISAIMSMIPFNFLLTGLFATVKEKYV